MTKQQIFYLSMKKFVGVFIIISFLSAISCFNLENRLPIYKFDSLKDSYFGYSVATHVQGEPDEDAIKW